MIVSSKGRYALCVMLKLADRFDEGYVPLKEIAKSEDISHKYLESIMGLLSKNGLVLSLHGKGGGYMLSKKPAEYTLLEILLITEGTLAPVSCEFHGQKKRESCIECRTLPVWENLEKMIEEYFGGITLADLGGNLL